MRLRLYTIPDRVSFRRDLDTAPVRPVPRYVSRRPRLGGEREIDVARRHEREIEGLHAPVDALRTRPQETLVQDASLAPGAERHHELDAVGPLLDAGPWNHAEAALQAVVAGGDAKPDLARRVHHQDPLAVEDARFDGDAGTHALGRRAEA